MNSTTPRRISRAEQQLAAPPPPKMKGPPLVQDMLAAFGLGTVEELEAGASGDEDEDSMAGQASVEEEAPGPAAETSPKPAASSVHPQHEAAHAARPAASSSPAKRLRLPRDTFSAPVEPPAKKPRRTTFRTSVRYRRWPAYSLTHPFVDTPSGLRVRFPVFDGSDDYGLAGDLPTSELDAAVQRVLDLNQELQGNHNYTLAGADKSTLRRLLALLPVEMLKKPAAGDFAFQPLSGTRLNVEIAEYERPALPYYVYLGEVFLKERDIADSFLDFAQTDEMIELAADYGQLRKYQAWLRGLRRFVDAGGWQGEWKRVTSYSGEADGWDAEIGPDEKIEVRAFAHYVGPDAKSNPSLHKVQLKVISRFVHANQGVAVDPTLSFVCTGADLDPTGLSNADNKLLEAITSVLRFSPADWGGGNVSSCGLVNHVGDMLHVVSRFAPGTPLTALRDLPDVPASIYLGLVSRFVPSTTCGEAVIGLSNSRQLRSKSSRATTSNKPASREPKLKTRLFADSGSKPFQIDPSLTLLQSLQNKYSSEAPLIDLRLDPVDQLALAPYSDSPFYPALYSLSRAAKQQLPPIVTRKNLRVGVQLHMGQDADNTPGYHRRARSLRFVLAYGKRAMVAMFRIQSEYAAGSVLMRYEEEDQQITLSRDGEVLVVWETCGVGSTDYFASYSPEELIDRVEAPRTSGKSSKERNAKTQQRTEVVEDLLQEILS
ncbi:hypothetical protein NBRC10512_000004 [Rhodotorula toruloides]|uniref:RHTO0S04e07206g1_1 n=2 Tax=Rhodotorula toruloides TaxID=5286 RepID=A0A061AR41_RHOTO|nr:uncharacterized protein RHTO_02066 [Rhodotorula toruloides NP11]EMS21195.1 hypothetical protein RHTO_02066 [Rhodotorula toruloides NP11]CDR39628.1 RHTO0S04e07206g1_1 [Rhodotorula toruloides]